MHFSTRKFREIVSVATRVKIVLEISLHSPPECPKFTHWGRIHPRLRSTVLVDDRFGPLIFAVTGASFVVFNGALKTSAGLTAKSSIVEDGLMIQITPESMLALKQALREMRNDNICCGTIGQPQPDETVYIQWVEDDKNVNIG